MIRALLLSAAKAAELTPVERRTASAPSIAGLLLRELGDEQAEAIAREALELIRAAREDGPALRLVK